MGISNRLCDGCRQDISDCTCNITKSDLKVLNGYVTCSYCKNPITMSQDGELYCDYYHCLKKLKSSLRQKEQQLISLQEGINYIKRTIKFEESRIRGI